MNLEQDFADIAGHLEWALQYFRSRPQPSDVTEPPGMVAALECARAVLVELAQLSRIEAARSEQGVAQQQVSAPV